MLLYRFHFISGVAHTKNQLATAIHSPVIYLNGTNNDVDNFSCSFLPFFVLPSLRGPVACLKSRRLYQPPPLFLENTT